MTDKREGERRGCKEVLGARPAAPHVIDLPEALLKLAGERETTDILASMGTKRAIAGPGRHKEEGNKEVTRETMELRDN